MYITVPSVSYRYIVHHNIITLQLYYLLLVIRNRIDRFAIVRRKKKKERTIHNTQTHARCFPILWLQLNRYALFFVCRSIIYVQKRYAYSTISMLFIFIIIYARLQWARTYFPLPSPFFVIFRSPLRWLLSSLSSFSVVRSNYDIRYLSFHRWINAASSNWRSYAISIRYIRIPNAFLSCLFFSIFLFLSLYLFIAYRKLSSALSPRGRRKIDLEKVANETQHGIGLRRTNSSRKRFLSLYPLLFPFLLPFPLLARRETKGSFLPRH